MNGRAEGWEADFFGSDDRRLLGCLHPPRADRNLGCGAVLIHSFGEEYIKFHRALRQLAVMLADEGFAVFRFDLSCCGDSAGACEDGRVPQWIEDIETAIAELRVRTGIARLSLVGLRLGGALAVMTGASRPDVDSLALWDPVISGTAYLDELESLHRDMLRYAHVIPRDTAPDPSEILGFRVSAKLRDSIAAVDLSSTQRSPAQRLLVVESHQGVSQRPLCERLEVLESNVELDARPAPELWSWVEDFSKVLVPQAILRRTTEWMVEPYR